ncbi:TPA: ead/Ea22-like family protein [Klebsiella pneumoniae]|nr:ead/Ea22-like family protein [Klebsiella pneumoniae]HDS3559552.1 ead/Ea22-like family protein [Klebsiella pneumoniae subsp. pneumoniae]HBY1859860.1 ead/Ea22-like family protein [Klebsiella pneumoniae]HBY1877165.1 ead/Ea22-like family protein [Klebsiella pneumoniae]HBY1890011.1 ead/Ea22-like family protein [Klebsiella pneumoniae]
MTDITELAQSLKAAAENAIGAHERLAAYPYGEIIDISQQEGEQIDIDITDINEFLEEASPANILALVDALEKAQANITKERELRVSAENRACWLSVAGLVTELETAQQVDYELCKLLPPGVEYMDPPDGGDVTPLEGVRRMVADYRQRIAELESRTVTVKLPESFKLAKSSSGLRYYYADEVDAALTAAGIKVEAE